MNIFQKIAAFAFIVIFAVIEAAGQLGGVSTNKLIQTEGGSTMFDPLAAVLVYLFTEGFKYLTQFLNQHGFPLVVNDWGTLALAIVTAVIIVLNQFGAGLPPDLARWIPVLITIILDVLGAIGIKATVKKFGTA